MKSILVTASKSYTVFIGNGLLILSMTTIIKFVFQGINSIKILRKVDIIHIKCDIQRILI